MDILKQIEDCVSKGQEYKELEERVLKQLKSELHNEILVLESKMPEGYSVGESYDFWVHGPGEKPTLSFNTPKKKNGDLTQEELDKLNEVLSEDFERIKKTYGIRITGFQFEVYA